MEQQEESICDDVIYADPGGAQGCRPEGVISGVCTSTGGSAPAVTICGLISGGLISRGLSPAFDQTFGIDGYLTSSTDV